MKTGTLNRITEAKNDFVPLVYVAEEIGCPLSDVFCVCIEGAFPLYVQCLDDIVDQAGVNTGRSFWVNCRVPDLIVRELVRCTEISVEQELLLAGTMTPNGSENWAQSLLIQCGPGRYTFKPANRDVTIRKRSLGVMEYHMDLVRAAIEQRKAKVESKMDAGDGKLEQDAASMEEEHACPEKFTLHWLEQKLFYDIDPSFALQAFAKLEQLDEQQPEKFRSTRSPASSATALINHWLAHRDLLATTFGRPVEDTCALTFSDCSIGDGIDMIDGELWIRRDELVALIQREGLTVPKFLASPMRNHAITEAPQQSCAERVIDKSAVVQPEMHESATRYQDHSGSDETGAKRLRLEPQGGDSLTGVVWTICYGLKEAGQTVKPARVMSKLREMADRREFPLLGVTAGGIKFEYEKGDERELNAETLRGRIREWRLKTGS